MPTFYLGMPTIEPSSFYRFIRCFQILFVFLKGTDSSLSQGWALSIWICPVASIARIIPPPPQIFGGTWPHICCVHIHFSLPTYGKRGMGEFLSESRSKWVLGKNIECYKTGFGNFSEFTLKFMQFQLHMRKEPVGSLTGTKISQGGVWGWERLGESPREGGKGKTGQRGNEAEEKEKV